MSGPHARHVDGLSPVSVVLEVGADDHRVRYREIGRHVGDHHPRAHQDGHAHRVLDGADVVEAGGDSSCAPRHDHAVGEEELAGLGGLGDADVGGDRVRRVLLLDVCEDGDAGGSDRAPVAQQITRARFDEALVGDVGEGEGFGPDERQTRGMGDRKGLAVRAGQNLHAAREACRNPHLGGDDAHRRHDLRSHASLQVRDVVHVLERDGVDAPFAQPEGVGPRRLHQLRHIERRAGCARQRPDVHHSDHDASPAEQLRERGGRRHRITRTPPRASIRWGNRSPGVPMNW